MQIYISPVFLIHSIMTIVYESQCNHSQYANMLYVLVVSGIHDAWCAIFWSHHILQSTHYNASPMRRKWMWSPPLHPARRSRSRSPLPRTWSEPEPRSRSSWDVRFRRSRWDPEPNWRRRRAWDRAWENHAHGAHHTHHGAGSHGPPPAPPPAPAPPPPPNVRPPAYPPPTMPMMPAVRPAFTSTAPSAPIHPPPAMPTAITVPPMPMPITLPFSVPARMLLPNPNLNHLHPGFPSIPGPGPSGSPTG